MARYAAVPSNPAKSASARGSYLRVSFKNTRETAQAVSGWKLEKAQKYLDQVLDHERAIPFRRFNGSIGRTGQGKEFGVTKARWPEKSVKFIQGLLQNAQSNAEVCIHLFFILSTVLVHLLRLAALLEFIQSMVFFPSL